MRRHRATILGALALRPVPAAAAQELPPLPDPGGQGIHAVARRVRVQTNRLSRVVGRINAH